MAVKVKIKRVKNKFLS